MNYNKNTVAYTNTTKNNNGFKYIIIGIVSVLLVTLAVVGLLNLINNDNNINENNTNNNSNINETSTYKVNFKGFTFNIPTNLIYQANDDYLLIGDEDSTWTTSVEVISGVYSQLLNNKGQLQSIYQKLGYEAGSAAEKTINGNSYITIELSKSGTNALLGLTKANSMYVFGLTILNVDNEYDYEILESLSSILNSATYTGESNSIMQDIIVDMSQIEELSK